MRAAEADAVPVRGVAQIRGREERRRRISAYQNAYDKQRHDDHHHDKEDDAEHEHSQQCLAVHVEERPRSPLLGNDVLVHAVHLDELSIAARPKSGATRRAARRIGGGTHLFSDQSGHDTLLRMGLSDSPPSSVRSESRREVARRRSALFVRAWKPSLVSCGTLVYSSWPPMAGAARAFIGDAPVLV